jgi:UDP-glucuronate 4-epimerase
MAYYAFTNSICQGKPIKIHNGGNVWRDFTYIDDIVDAIVSCLTKSASIKTASGPSNKNKMPYVIYNIGNNKPIKLTRFINILEKLLHKKAILESVALPNSDLLKTFADIRMAKKDLNYLPKTKIEVGLKRFVEWYIAYNGNAK